ncbi:MAG: homoserine kinase [Actinobacteria bacterium]|uniref:Homoserine kinase n=1 Tax=freshwater metagenome TaxID=449393 RepID=A0A6J6CHY1_9ZZZZ|nr:homoserine kinase [Actinomycetota bacterium]
MTKLRVTVPATSANLGPGFDSLGMALAFYDEYELETIQAGLEISIEGEGANSAARDETNLIFRSIKLVFDSVGEKLPGIRLICRNSIPHGRGMGSSGAAVAGGVMLAAGLLANKQFTEQQLLEFATKMEGHPDNVAPALFGGLTIAWVDETGPHHKKLTVHRGISPLVLVAPNEMSTKLARSLQPESVPHTDAVFNVSRSALLVAALTQSPELMMSATEDRLHQNYRASAMPETSRLISSLREKSHPAVVSGAGPSVLVLEGDPQNRLEAIQYVKEAFSDWRALALAVDFKGASLERQSGSGS